jgi:hypothetical protein
VSTPERADEFLDAVRAALDADPYVEMIGVEQVKAGEVRLLCPNGHFIAQVTVIDCGKDRLLLRPRSRDKQYFGNPFYSDTNHGFHFEERRDDEDPRLRVRLRCMRGKCPYSGAFDYFALARDLRTAASGARHAKYRLTG